MIRKSKNTSIIRSSAAEYLTYVAATGSSDESIELRYEDENIWLTQKMMATLYGVTELMYVQLMTISRKSMEIQNCHKRQLSENTG